MKTLEGQQAISYLDRLNLVLDHEVKSAISTPAAQGLLLLALFRLEQAYFQSFPNSATEKPQLLITASGFPSLPSTLAHADLALKLHQSKIEQKTDLAKDWLQAVGLFSDNDLGLANHVVQNSDHPYPEIASALAPLTLEQINFVKAVSRQPLIFPVATNHRHNLLVTRGQINYFVSRVEKDQKDALYYRKYLDSETFDPNLVLGDPKHPIDEKSPPKHTRFPVILAGQLDKNADHLGNAKEIFCPNVTAYLKSRELKNGRHYTKIVKSRIASVTELTFRQSFFHSNHDITEAFLDFDLTTLPDQTLDSLIENFSKIQNCFGDISDFANLMTKGEVVSGDKIRLSSEKLFAAIAAIENRPARQALHTAVTKALEKIIAPIAMEISNDTNSPSENISRKNK